MGWSVLFLDRRAMRSDAEWSFHFKALQRRPALRKLCTPTHSDLSNRVNQRIINNSIRIIWLNVKFSG